MRQIRFAVFAAAVASSLALQACSGGGSVTKEIPVPKGTPFTAEQTAQLHQIRDDVADLREKPVNGSLSESVLTRNALQQWYDEQKKTLSDKDRHEIESFNIAYRLLHLIGPDDDLYDSYSGFFSGQTAGFYDPTGNALVLIADHGQITAGDEGVLAHEYVHSFQYGALNTKRLDERADQEKDSDPTEYRTTTDCIVEGDATLAQAGYSEVYGNGNSAEASPAEAPAEDESPPIPPALERYAMFNYNECGLFVLSLFVGSNGEWDAVNGAYDRPPSTTEQVMHPEKYHTGEGATDMHAIDIHDRLGNRWKQKNSSIFGEFDLYNYLYTVLDDQGAAANAASGWGIGWVNVYENAKTSEVLVHIQLEFDSDSDFSQFVGTYQDVVEKVAGKRMSSAGAGAMCWDNDGEHGYFTYAEGMPRVDIIVSTTAEARDAAAKGSLSAVTMGACAKA